MSTERIHNFSAGPAVLPLSVVEELQEALPNLAGTGIGLMEISHRSQTFGDIVYTQRLLQFPEQSLLSSCLLPFPALHTRHHASLGCPGSASIPLTPHTSSCFT